VGMRKSECGSRKSEFRSGNSECGTEQMAALNFPLPHSDFRIQDATVEGFVHRGIKILISLKSKGYDYAFSL